MQIDLDREGVNPGSLPRFQRAPLQSQRLLTLSSCLALLGIAALVLARKLSPSLWQTLSANLSAAFLVLAAALESAYAVAGWRSRAMGAEGRPRWMFWRRAHHISAPSAQAAPPDVLPASVATGSTASQRFARIRTSVGSGLRRFDERFLQRIGTEFIEAFWLGGLALLAWIAVRMGWNLSLVGADLGRAGVIAGGLALLLAFVLLVLERHFATTAPAEWPEGMRMAQLTRVVIAVLLLISVVLFYSSASRVWPARLAVFIGVLPAAVALEMMVRAIASTFSKRSVSLEPHLLANSMVAGLFHWPLRPLHTLQDELKSRFGINLRQNWAFSFIRRRSLPVLAGIVFVAWLLSGVTEIRIDGRGIYERFGKPVAVLGPGLHVGLPWPFSSTLHVENGVVHELATATAEGDVAPPADTSTADGPAPDRANRLWDASHVAEKAQVIASVANDKQSFQVVNMDVRFVYRIGLTNEAALAATYNSADVPALIRSTANRILVRDFASRTLDRLLGEARTELAHDIGTAVQDELNRLNSGVEILATVLEAIHPPAGAANAYHSVQAAQITAIASVARERGNAAQRINDAQLSASLSLDKVTAAASEAKSNASVISVRFAAEQKAYQSAGKAFLLEQYYSQLGKGLSNGSLIILDHRIGGALSPTIDLRSFAAPTEN